MHAITTERLILVAGVVLVVLFFVTWEPIFGVLSMVLLVGLAPWLDVDETER